MINKLSALLFANNVLVKAALAGYQTTLCVGSNGCTPEVELTVFYSEDSDIDVVESILNVYPLPLGSTVVSNSRKGIRWFDLIIPFEL